MKNLLKIINSLFLLIYIVSCHEEENRQQKPEEFPKLDPNEDPQTDLIVDITKVECATQECQESLDKLLEIFEHSERVFIGTTFVNPPDEHGVTLSQDVSFWTDAEATRVRKQLLGSFKEYLNLGDKAKLEGNEDYIFEGCEGNLYQGDQESSESSLYDCASFLLSSENGVNIQFLVYDNRQFIYVNQKGFNYSGFLHGSAVFAKRKKTKAKVSIVVKPTLKSAVVSKIPVPISHFSTISESYRQALLLETRPKSFNELSDAYLENRINTLKLIPETATAIASIGLGVLTLPSAFATVSTVPAHLNALWATINAISFGAGMMGDVSKILNLENEINVIEDDELRMKFKLALITVDMASFLGVTKIFQNPGRSLSTMQSAYRSLLELGVIKELRRLNVNNLSISNLSDELQPVIQEIYSLLNRGTIFDINSLIKRKSVEIAGVIKDAEGANDLHGDISQL